MLIIDALVRRSSYFIRAAEAHHQVLSGLVEANASLHQRLHGVTIERDRYYESYNEANRLVAKYIEDLDAANRVIATANHMRLSASEPEDPTPVKKPVKKPRKKAVKMFTGILRASEKRI